MDERAGEAREPANRRPSSSEKDARVLTGVPSLRMDLLLLSFLFSCLSPVTTIVREL